MGVISFKTENEAQAAIEILANIRGVSPGVLCRTIVLAEIGVALQQKRVMKKVADRDVLRSLLGELGKQGNLLNQIARSGHLGRTSEVAVDLAAMRNAYLSALQAVAAVLGVEKDP